MSEIVSDPLEYVTRFDVPVPGYPDKSVVVRKARPGYVNGPQWAVTDDSECGSAAWTGTDWVYRGELSREEIHRWDRDQALVEAVRLASVVAEEIAQRWKDRRLEQLRDRVRAEPGVWDGRRALAAYREIGFDCTFEQARANLQAVAERWPGLLDAVSGRCYAWESSRSEEDTP